MSNCGCGHNPPSTNDTAGAAVPQTEGHAECPVMKGRTVVKADAEAAGLFRDYQGQRYWLCCKGCGPRFDADPARYATAS
jgi:YHS domain-containing protein